MRICFSFGFFTCFTFLLVSSVSADRTVSIYVNPGCGSLCETNGDIKYDNGTQINLVYVRADGDNDTIHYLWSSIGSFSILIVKTDRESELQIDWNRILSSNPASSINFTHNTQYASAAVFTTLWAYDDVNDEADVALARNNLTTAIPFQNFTWASVKATNVSDSEVQAEFVLSTDWESVYGRKTLRLVLGAFGDTDHYEHLPKLLHTPSSLQIELILDDFVSNQTNGRFALELALISDETTFDDYLLEKLLSIDDEYTPGVFTTVQITSPFSRSNGFGSYLLWKPVCYTSSDRVTEYSTDTKQSFGNISLSSRSDEMSNSIANAYYGSNMSNVLISFVNVSYGLEEDGFYEITNYLSWTATFGIGAPPKETFSSLVIIVIVVGFGVPGLLIVIGGLFIVVRRFRSKGDELQFNVQSSKIMS